MSFHKNVRFGVLAALSLLYALLMAFTFNSLGQVLPFMVADLGMNWAEAGLGFTLLGIACGAASLLPAIMIRRIGVPMTLLAGAAMLVAGFATLAATHSVFSYHLGTTLLGLGYCFCGTVPSVHIISSIFRRRSTALGIYFTSGNVGAVLGPLFFYMVSELLDGWRIYWLLCAIAMLVVGLLAATLTRMRSKDLGDGHTSEAFSTDFVDGWAMRHALATPQYWTIVGAYTVCLLINTTVHSFGFQHLLENGQSKGSATALISLTALVAAIASGAAGLLGERMDPRRMSMLALASFAFSSLALTFPRSEMCLALFVIGMGVGLGLIWVSTAMLMQNYFGRRANLELYSIMTWLSTSAAAGPALGGIMRDRIGTFGPMFVGLAVMNLLLLVIVVFMRRPVPGAAQLGNPVSPAQATAV
jgi:MFS family permease